MNWEIFWSVLFALIVALSLFTLDLKRHRKEQNRLLRITLADYVDYKRENRRYDRSQIDHAPDSPESEQAEMNRARTREWFTGEDMADHIKDLKNHQELVRMILDNEGDNK